MAKKKVPLPLRRQIDPVHFLAVINWCLQRSLPIVRCSDYQIKCDGWNYYTNSSFHHDGDVGRRGKGFKAFTLAVEAWLEDEGLAEAVKTLGQLEENGEN
jgi:hypothetical protein